MKTAHEIFQTLGAPIALSSSDYGPNRYTGFRAFSEDDIKLIQDEAHRQGLMDAELTVYRLEMKWGPGDGYSPTKAAAANEIACALRLLPKLP